MKISSCKDIGNYISKNNQNKKVYIISDNHFNMKIFQK